MTSLCRGVSWDARQQKWLAGIKVDGRRRTLGWFPEEEDAVRAYDQAAKELFGEFAYLNFPEPAMSVEDEEF